MSQTKSTIKWIKVDAMTYKSMNTHFIIFQILTPAENGFSQWYVSKDENSEYTFSGSFNQCKTYVLEMIKSMEWKFELHYQVGNTREVFYSMYKNFTYGYRLFWMMVKELQLHKKSKSPIQIIDIWKNENNNRIAHPLEQYTDAQLGIMNSETPISIYKRIKSGKTGHETFTCLVNSEEVSFDQWWIDVRLALKSGIAKKIQDTDEVLTYEIKGK